MYVLALYGRLDVWAGVWRLGGWWGVAVVAPSADSPELFKIVWATSLESNTIANSRRTPDELAWREPQGVGGQ